MRDLKQIFDDLKPGQVIGWKASEDGPGGITADELVTGLTTAVTNIQTVVGADAGWAVTNVTPDTTFDANATTLDEIADVLGTLITSLIAKGIIQAPA